MTAVEKYSAIDNEAFEIESAKQNPKHFEVLYDRYYIKIFTFILSKINDKEQSADITSQVFLKALVQIKKFKHEGFPFSSWLYRVALNECNQFFRQTKKSRSVVLNHDFSQALIDEVNQENLEEDKTELLISTIQKLNIEEVQLLELRFFENKSFKEVGYILNITENNAKVKLYRLLDKMRKLIKGRK